MEKKVALVTGASRGIGRAIAIDLAKEGADVIVNYRSSSEAAEDVVKLIKESGRQAMSIKADVANDHEVKDMIERAKEEFGGIDVLVNNAALHRGGRIQKMPPEDWELVINSILKGAFNCCRYVVPLMVGKKWGRIINISSDAGLHGYPGTTAYGGGKSRPHWFFKIIGERSCKKEYYR